jgi:hypothetical protein
MLGRVSRHIALLNNNIDIGYNGHKKPLKWQFKTDGYFSEQSPLYHFLIMNFPKTAEWLSAISSDQSKENVDFPIGSFRPLAFQKKVYFPFQVTPVFPGFSG